MHPAFFRHCLLLSLLFQSTLSFADVPQPKLPTISLIIGTETLVAEVADDPNERNTGMMFRESMADGAGMLFVMDRVGPVSFWMRNTTVPLSIAYLNTAGVIMEIHDLQPHDETSVNSEFQNIAYTIEVPQGWFSRVGIFPGQVVDGLPPFRR
ncbi:MAG: DUF192 domain-containing protein [Chthoniobacterales bacterium]